MFELLIGFVAGAVVMVVFPKVYAFVVDKFQGLKGE